jgi:hypothetical protein
MTEQNNKTDSQQTHVDDFDYVRQLIRVNLSESKSDLHSDKSREAYRRKALTLMNLLESFMLVKQ